MFIFKLCFIHSNCIYQDSWGGTWGDTWGPWVDLYTAVQSARASQLVQSSCSFWNTEIRAVEHSRGGVLEHRPPPTPHAVPPDCPSVGPTAGGLALSSCPEEAGLLTHPSLLAQRPRSPAPFPLILFSSSDLSLMHVGF